MRRNRERRRARESKIWLDECTRIIKKWLLFQFWLMFDVCGCEWVRIDRQTDRKQSKGHDDTTRHTYTHKKKTSFKQKLTMAYLMSKQN